MKRLLFLLTLLLCLAVASTALAAPRPDKATGTCTFGAEGSTYSFEAFEEVGTPGEPGYRPVKGWVTVVGNPWVTDGTWPVVDCEVYDDAAFSIGFDVNGSIVYTNSWRDDGEPGWTFDNCAYGSLLVTAGNIQVHNYPDDGD